MGKTRRTGRRGTSAAYREVIGLTGPLLPVMSFLARLPTATIQFGSVLLVARASGSLSAAGLTGGALAVGQVACGPLVGRLADRHGQRAVVLTFCLANALAIAGLVVGALAGLPTAVLAVLGAAAGATVPQIGPMARARLVALARGAGARDSTVGAALSFESTLDEISFVLGPALVGLAAVTAHPGFALGGAAVLVALCGAGFALHRTAAATRPASVATPGERRCASGATSSERGGERRSGSVRTSARRRAGADPTEPTGRTSSVPTSAPPRTTPA
ncbi:MFS transporter, partial [Streptomyces viridochromogenes]